MDTNSLSISIIIDYCNSGWITFYFLLLSSVIDYCKLLSVIIKFPSQLSLLFIHTNEIL